MTSHSLQPCSQFGQAPFVAGAPGPPVTSLCFMGEDGNDDMLYRASAPGEPDDLGDLMREMREGTVWVEDFHLDGEAPGGACLGPPSPNASAPPLPFWEELARRTPPYHSRLSSAAGPGVAPASPPAAGGGGVLPDMLEFGQQGPPLAPAASGQHPPAPQPLAAPEEAPLQPAMAAKLLHPDTFRGGAGVPRAHLGHMIPVAGLPGVGCKDENSPQMQPGAAQMQPPGMAMGWLPPGMPFFCGPPPCAPGMMHPAPAGFYGHSGSMPLHHASVAAFQGPPPGLFTSDSQSNSPMLTPPSQDGPARMAAGAAPPAAAEAAAVRCQMSEPKSSGDLSDHTQLRTHHRIPTPHSDGDAGGASKGRGCLPPSRVPSGTALASFFMCEAPSEGSDLEDQGSIKRQLSQPQVVPDAGFAPPGPFPPPPYGGSMFFPPMPSCFAQGGGGLGGLLPLPSACFENDTPAAHTARVARQLSLERYRLKKARRSSTKVIRYQKRKANADKRPRIKGRFIRADEAAAILAADGAGLDSPAAGIADVPAAST